MNTQFKRQQRLVRWFGIIVFVLCVCVNIHAQIDPIVTITVDLPKFATIRAYDLSADGKMIATAGIGEIHLWDTGTGDLMRTFNIYGDGNVPGINGVRCLVISPDGQYLLAGGEPYIAKLWDLQTGELIRTILSPDYQYLDQLPGIMRAQSIESVDFSPDSKTYLTFDYNKILQLWDVETGKELKRFNGYIHSPSIWRFDEKLKKIEDLIAVQKPKFLSDGKHLLAYKMENVDGQSADFHHVIRIDSGEIVRSIRGYSNQLFDNGGCLIMNEEMREEVRNEEDGFRIKTIIRDLNSGNVMREFVWNEGKHYSYLTLSNSRKFLLMGGYVPSHAIMHDENGREYTVLNPNDPSWKGFERELYDLDQLKLLRSYPIIYNTRYFGEHRDEYLEFFPDDKRYLVVYQNKIYIYDISDLIEE